MTKSRWTIVLLAGVSPGALAAPVVEKSATTPVTSVSSEQLENLPTGRSVADLIRTCPSQTIPTVNRNSLTLIDGVSAQPGIECIKPDDVRMIEVYKLHNQARFEVGSQPLVWDPGLAAQAQSYGPELAQYGRPVHSSRVGRETSRENLLQALPGTSASAMVGVWTAEKRNFLNGVFPDVSLTGNWADVGHYTQIVWPATTNLGCAIHTGGQFDWLICRYSPPGNKDGKMVLAEREKEPPLPPTTSGGLIHPGGIPAPRGPSTAPQGYYQLSDHIPVKAEYEPPACAPRSPAVQASTPPPESILDDIGQDFGADDNSAESGDYMGPVIFFSEDRLEGGGGGAFEPRLSNSTIDLTDPNIPSISAGRGESPTPPPESILDDVGEGSAGPPPESLLDDVGQFQTDKRQTPPPPPKTEKGKAVHDTPMAQPQYPNVEPRCVEMAREVPERCPDTPPPPCRDEEKCDLDMTKPPTLDPTRVRPTSDSPSSLYTYRQAARDRFYKALKASDWYGADIELLEMEYVLDEIRKTDNDMLKRQFERQLKTDQESRLRGGCD